MRFKNQEDWQAQRTLLINEIKELMAQGKQEEAKTKIDEVKAMDNDWNNDKVELANTAALEGKIFDLIKVGEGEVMQNNGNVLGTPLTDEMAYRKSFMNYVVNGGKMPVMTNGNTNTKTSDIGAVIPETVLSKIIEKIEATCMILSRVTRTSIKGGVTIPTSSVKPTASWVAEGTGSDKQKKTTGSLTFAYHKLRCAVSVSLEVDTMALEVFERVLINNVAEAMTKALEQAILTGDGVGKPKGIFTETVITGQNVNIAADSDLTLQTLESAEAALPLAYENGAVWLMTKKTYLKAKFLKDANGQYIFREVHGTDGSVKRYLFEREVVLNDYMTSLGDTISTDTIVAALFNLEDYVLNTNYAMGVREYIDNETEDKVRKSVMLVDGKVIDKNSLVTITKKA